MKTILFSNSALSMPVCLDLVQKQMLAGVVIPNRVHQANMEMKQLAAHHNITLFEANKASLASTLPQWLHDQGADVLLTITFPWKLPPAVLNAAKHGGYNFHFGLLPSYKGADPIFWQMINREKHGGVSVHKMTDDIDAGDLFAVEQLPLTLGETWGIHAGKLSFVSVGLANKLLSALSRGKVKLSKQSKAGKWYGRPTDKDLTIQWKNHHADDVEALVNAANPTFNGALTYFKGSPVRILEVSPADVPNAPIATPGSIVYADQQYGMFVLCKDYKFIRINIMQSREGTLTGTKLVALGIKVGDKFTDSQLNA